MSLIQNNLAAIPVVLYYVSGAYAASGSLDEDTSGGSNSDDSGKDSGDSGSKDSGSKDSGSKDSGSKDTGAQDTGAQDTDAQDTDAQDTENSNDNPNDSNAKGDAQTTQWWTPTTMVTDTATTATEKTKDKKETDTDKDTKKVTYNQYGFTGDQSRWEASTEDSESSSNKQKVHSAKNKTSSASRNLAFIPEKNYTMKKAVLISSLLGISALFTAL